MNNNKFYLPLKKCENFFRCVPVTYKLSNIYGSRQLLFRLHLLIACSALVLLLCMRLGKVRCVLVQDITDYILQ